MKIGVYCTILQQFYMNLIIIVGGLYTEMAVNFMNDARDWDNYIDTDIDCNLAFLS